MSTLDERNLDPITEMRRITTTIMKLDSWGFSESYSSLHEGKLIFDSERCRVRFTWGGWDSNGGNSIHIHYGRLHAANEKNTIFWINEECHCWHDIDHPLNLLDGLHPADTLKRYYSHPITNPFYESEFRKRFERRQPEWLAEMHLTIWKHYGNRFFELFNIGRPDLWQQYQSHLKEFYDLKGRRLGINPPLDKVC